MMIDDLVGKVVTIKLGKDVLDGVVIETETYTDGKRHKVQLTKSKYVLWVDHCTILEAVDLVRPYKKGDEVVAAGICSKPAIITNIELTQRGHPLYEIYYPHNRAVFLVGEDILTHSVVGGLVPYPQKSRPDWIPADVLLGMGDVLAWGKGKYPGNDWKSMSPDLHLAAAQRHLLKHSKGEQNDDESGMNHLYHAMVRLAFYTHLTNSSGAKNSEQV